MCQSYSKPNVGRFLRHGVNVNFTSVSLWSICSAGAFLLSLHGIWCLLRERSAIKSVLKIEF